MLLTSCPLLTPVFWALLVLFWPADRVHGHSYTLDKGELCEAMRMIISDSLQALGWDHKGGRPHGCGPWSRFQPAHMVRRWLTARSMMAAMQSG